MNVSAQQVQAPPVYLVYVDEAMEANDCFISALAVPHDRWDQCLEEIKAFRVAMRDQYGMFIRKELHAREFVSGRGRVGPKPIPKGLRCHIYREALRLTTRLPGVILFNALAPKKREAQAFDWLLNRVHTNVSKKQTQALFLCDEGKEYLYPSIARRRRVHNPMPSKFGIWSSTGTATKQIPTKRIIEDPQFIRSDRSYFIQLADCCAYALLRRERRLPSKDKYDLHLAFDILNPILVKEATQNDPLGILRVTDQKNARP